MSINIANDYLAHLDGDGRHFAYDILKLIFVNEHGCNSIRHFPKI